MEHFVDIVILIGGFFLAIERIYKFFAVPGSKLTKRAEDREKKRIKGVLDAELPKYLEAHDIKTRDKYKADRTRYLNEIKEEVLKEVGDPISKNADDLEALKISARDVLREKIMAIYHKNKHERVLTQYEKEALEQYYKDYKRLLGNSYIDKYYARMCKWSIVYDDYMDDDE